MGRISDLEELNSVDILDSDYLVVDTANQTKKIAVNELLSDDRLETEERSFVGAINELHDEINDVTTMIAANHNNIYRGKNLLSDRTISEVCTDISSGNFEDIYIGDYIETKLTYEDKTTETVKWLVAGIDNLRLTGDTQLSKYHVVMVAEHILKTLRAMNEGDTDTTAGGYANSTAHTYINGKFADALEAALPSGSVIPFRDLLSSAVTDGVSSESTWTTCRARLLSSTEIYGFDRWGSRHDDHVGCTQLPLFRLNPMHRSAVLGYKSSATHAYWLTTVYNNYTFAISSKHGHIVAMNTSKRYGLRPMFLLG